MSEKKTRRAKSDWSTIIRTVQTPLAFFVLVVLVVEVMFGLLASINPDQRAYLVGAMMAIILVLVGIVTILAIRWPEALTGIQPASSEVVQSTIETREAYLREAIDHTRRAEKTISMCVHTLLPAHAGNDVKELQQALAAKNALPGGVMLLAPTGQERIRASVELNGLGIPVHHLALLQDLDISFSVFDSMRCVLPTKSGKAEGTVAGVSLESTKLAQMLEAFLNDLWSRFDVLPHEDFIRFTVKQIVEANPAISLDLIAQKLEIDSNYLGRLLPAFGANAACELFFLIGRPCSGKTTVANALRSTLATHGIRSDEIYDFNDYEALYRRFLRDTGRHVFTEENFRGFAVRDFSILDTVLQQANFRLSTAIPFFRVCIVEFARDSYLHSFLHFQRHILERSTVIHTNCSLNTCRNRNAQRGVPSSDYRTGRVPDSILDSFYANDNLDGIEKLPFKRIVELDTDNVPLGRLQTFLEENIFVQSPSSH